MIHHLSLCINRHCNNSYVVGTLVHNFALILGQRYGSIVVRTEVICSLPAEPPMKKRRHKKSGKTSRKRLQDLRRNENSCTAGKADTSEYESMVDSMNSTAIEKPSISIIEKEALESKLRELEIEIQKKDAQI